MRSVATHRTLLQQDRGWGLFCQISVAPLLAGTLEWLIAVGAFWFIGVPYVAPWTWLAHLAAAYPQVGAATGLRALSVAWAGWAFLRTGMAWGELTPYLWFLLISALAAAPQRWGVWTARIAVQWTGALVHPADGPHLRSDRPGRSAPAPDLEDSIA